MPGVSVASVPRQSRVTRRPQHTFLIQHRPYVLQPFFIAPVLPGETMRQLMIQSRAVTDPVKNPLMGWWLEHYVFYVKHRDLHDRANWEDMVLNANFDPTTVDDPAVAPFAYHAGTVGAINWTMKAIQRIVEEFFRAAGDTWNNTLSEGLPVAFFNAQNWLDSIKQTDALTTETEVGITVGADDMITVKELDKAREQYEMLVMNSLTAMTYEEWLATYGVKTAKQELHKPELVRYTRAWQYPSNTVNPADGKPSSALSWVVSERADKDRYFAEPGFLIGLSVARPKMYFGNLKGSAVAFMNNAFDWLPAVLTNDPRVSMKEMATATGPLSGSTKGYTWDTRDLLLYGDQFVNDLGRGGLVPRPNNANMSWRQPAADHATLVAPFFTDTTAYASGSTTALQYVRQDGIVTIHIATSQKDQTPGTAVFGV